MLATFPAFLPLAWDAARVNSEAADSIRRHAVLDWRDPPDHYRKLRAKGWPEDRVRQLILTLDALNYGNPKYLLLMMG